MYDWAHVRLSVSWTTTGRDCEDWADFSVDEQLPGNRSATNTLPYMVLENFKDSPRDQGS